MRYDPLLANYTWPDGRCVRSNAVSAFDGSISRDGSSKPISGGPDTELFHHLRATADIVLVGASTAVNEDYIGVILPDQHKDTRVSLGRSSPPPLAIATHSGRVSGPRRFLEKTETQNFLIVTGGDDCLNRATELTESSNGALKLIDGSRGLSNVISYFANLGYARIVCEGGPRLLNALTEAELIDEFCLTISPHAGGDARSTQTVSPRYEYVPVFADIVDGFVFTRWIRSKPLDACHS